VKNSNPLRKTIGIIGGGQLGRMMIEESLRLNNDFNILDAADCSCAALAKNHIVGKLTDAEAIKKLADISDVLTFEIEHINVDVLIELEEGGKEIIPSPKVLKVIQDKGIQKEFFVTHNIPTAPFVLVNTTEDWLSAINKFGGEKLVAKTRKDGYDGKGVTIFKTADVLADVKGIPFNSPSLIEAFIPCQKEISVMVARDTQGNIKTWPVVEMEFDPIANLVTFLDCPASLSPEKEQEAREIALNTIEKLNGVGVYAVEMFLTQDNQILVNEVAPRPHNSGHHTIEACYTSQFEQLVRILMGLPLGSTELIQPGVMMNLLGADDFSGTYRLQGLEEVSAMEGVYVHLYGKKESKPMRKMGHVTVTASTIQQAKNKAKQVSNIIKFVAD
jgi:5-(carboxyamino)imidazole ribonucleotide synthase